jgi:ribonucleoside-diphosphate reductase alpha chain
MELSQRLLSEVTIYSKYSKFISEKNRRETWEELVFRNMMMHVNKYPALASEIVETYQLVFEKKVLPSMRSLQFAGLPIEINNTRIFNCSYLPIDSWEAFHEVMFLLLGGTGVGYSVQKKHVNKLPEVKKPNNKKKRFLIPDSIEGWADTIKELMYSYFFGTSEVTFDYRGIRAKGAPIKTAGGKAPGPEPLKFAVENVKKILDAKAPNSKLTSLEVHDIICYISDAVLAGGIRRSALIAGFSLNDEAMLGAKSGDWYNTNPQRARANNSAVLLRHRIKKDDFDVLWTKVKDSGCGEPGIYFSNNADIFSNPCCEISLKPMQFCNLTSFNVSDVTTQEEFNLRAKAAAFIGTLQASYTDFHYLRDTWKETTEKEALLGVSMTGIASGGVLRLSMKEAAECVKQENARVAKIIGINAAARCTAVKPEGTLSLVVGSSSGIHAWHSQYYIRRMRFNKMESIAQYLMKEIPELIEEDKFNSNQIVLSIPVKAPEGAITRHESAIEMLERVKKVSLDWVKTGHRRGDNTHNVSATVSVKQEEWDGVGEWMWNNRDCYNGLSVLPADNGSYVQAPFEDCDELTYRRMLQYAKNIDLTKVTETEDKTQLKENVACGGGACEVV